MSGRYKILEELGVGGAGSVCKAYDTQLNRYVALKRLLTKEEEQQQDTQSSSLRQEAASLATLQHPNIVTIYDLASDDDGLFIVMELLEGETLSDWLQGETLTVGDFYELATQTLEAVLSAHGQSILHRDLKPENMKVKRLPGGRLQIKIVDFGLARLSYGAKKQTEDQRGHILGSIFYMAPEQFLRRPLDGRTDLYSLGCVYYQTLSGRRPFQAASVAEVMDMHLKHQVTLLHDVRPDLPSQLCDWVMWLMNSEPGERPANAQQALDSLRGLAADGALAEVAPSPMAPPNSVGEARPTTGTLSPRTTSSLQPVRRSTSSVGGRIPTGPLVARRTSSFVPRGSDDDDPAMRAASTPAKASLAWLYIVIGIVALVAGGIFFLKSRGLGKSAAGAGVGAQGGGFLASLPADSFVPGSLVHWVAGEKTEAWATGGNGGTPAKTDDLVMKWQALSTDAASAVLGIPDQRRESCPKLVAGQTDELMEKVNLLRFDAGNCLVHRADQAMAAHFPFGADAKNEGLTVYLVVRPRLSGQEVCCLRLRNSDGKAWIQIQAFPKNEFRASVGVRKPDGTEIVKECTLPQRNTKKFSIVSLRWDAGSKKITLSVRNADDNRRRRAECPAPPNCPVLDVVSISEPPADAAHPSVPGGVFTGDIRELILWPFNMTQDQHADQGQKLAERYFKNPGSKW